MAEVKEINGKIVEVSPESKVFYIAKEKGSGILGGFEELKVIPISEPTVIAPVSKEHAKEEKEYRPAWALTEEEKERLAQVGKKILDKISELMKKPDKDKYAKMMRELGIDVL
ncbi:MAG: hypothetical protein QW734_07085 [Candidatus Bathyarchaeia archaeon]